MTSNASFSTSTTDSSTLGQSSAPIKLSAHDDRPMLAMDDLRNLDFELLNGCARNSWSPKAAFDAREAGEVGHSRDYETLHEYLTEPGYIGIATKTLLEVSQGLVPKTEELMTVYRAADRYCGMKYGVILPGASVTDSKAYAKRYATLCLDGENIQMATNVYPDELVTRGDPHEFTYVPRSLLVGYERYVADVQLTTANA